MARQRGFRHQRSSRLTQWIGPADQAYITVATTVAGIISSVSFEEPVTVMRARGMFSLKVTDPSTDENIVGAVGMAVVSTEAFTAGVASVPEPYTDADWGGWFVWRSFGYGWDVTTDIGRQWSSRDFEIDSKAMRKVSPNETVIIVVESVVGAIDVLPAIRMLVKLP